MIYYIALVKRININSVDFDGENLYEIRFSFDRYEPAYEKLKQYREGYDRSLSHDADDGYAGIVMFSSASTLYQVTFIQNDPLEVRTGYNVWYKNTDTNRSPHWDNQPYEVAKMAVDDFNDNSYNLPFNSKFRVKAVCFPSI